MTQPKKLTEEQLIEVVRGLLDTHKGSKKKLAALLNANGLLTLSGKSWTSDSVKHFVTRKLKAPKEAPPSVTSKQTAAVPADEIITGTTQEQVCSPLPADNVAVMSELVSSYQSGKLNEMLKWFDERQQRGEVMVLPENRPTFKGEKRNTGILISEEIKAGALKRMEKDKHRVGGSLSLLIEYLLWQYQGAPRDLVVGADPEPAETA